LEGTSGLFFGSLKKILELKLVNSEFEFKRSNLYAQRSSTFPEGYITSSQAKGQ